MKYIFRKIEIMKITPLLGVAKFLVTSKKMKLLLIGAQFGYVGYKYLKNRKRKRSTKSSKTVKTS